MKNFIIYDLDGYIKRTGYVPDDAFELQVGEGEFIIEGTADPKTQKIDVINKTVVSIFISPEQVLEQLRLNRSVDINSLCRSAIVSGFVSYALGQPYHYPSKVTDQQNLAASVLASYDPENASDWTTPFWCSDAAGEWAFRPHTAAQIREVGRDAKSAIIACQFKNESLQAEILAATTVGELDAIVW